MDTPSLAQRIHARIREQGPLRFGDFMAMALYEPGLGYYARGVRQVGKGGDFFTSVSVGPLFGQLLARRCAAEWEQLGRPARWRITECGAHDGTLAKDILDTLQSLQPEALASLEYAIPEPLDSLRDAQRNTLQNHAARLRLDADCSHWPPLPGIVVGNELIDALPVQLVECHQHHWQECRVISNGDQRFTLALHPIDDPELLSLLQTIGSDFPDGYRTEVRTGLQAFLQPLAKQLERGHMIWIDYGFTRDDYYHPARHSGTLRTFDRHQAGDSPLDAPGELDITAHVDFTTLAECARNLGGQPADLQSQGSWLTTLARDWLLQMEGQPQAHALRQFQTLTHPSQLGRSFSVLEIAFNR